MDAAALADLQATLQAMDARALPEDGDGVWPENWDIVCAFLEVASQWRVTAVGGGGFAGMGGAAIAPVMPMFIGLDYSAVRVGLDALGIAVTPDLWRGLLIMENAACAALNEER